MISKNSLMAVFLLAVILLLPLPALAEVSLTSQGIGIINSPNVQKPEEDAKQDAYNKALTQYALRLVPQSMHYPVLKKMPELVAGRGMQDATIIKLVSKTLRSNAVYVTYEFRINDDFIKQWISLNKFDVPTELRPRILIAVSTLSPGETGREWWQSASEKKYSGFESLLASELALWGQNVFIEAPDSRAVGIDPLTVASLYKANLLISGIVKVQPSGGSMNLCTLKIDLTDVSTKAPLSSWNFSKKAELPAKELYSIMISSFFDDIRLKIDSRISNVAIPDFEATICIDNIRNYQSYQKFLDALTTTAGITELQTSSMYGNSICHTAKIRGTMNDVMQRLKDNISGADIQIKDDSAHIVIE